MEAQARRLIKRYKRPMKHILFTSRDVGAAHQLKHIIRAFARSGFTTTIVASRPAYDLFCEEGFSPELFVVAEDRPFLPKDAPQIVMDQLLLNVKQILLKARPDAVFSGVGTANYGIDEAAIYWAHPTRLNIPSFQFLDAAGTFNHLHDGYPDLYFGMDDTFLRYSGQGARAPIEIVGAPKYEQYANFPIVEWRKELREQFRLTGDVKMIGYFGQDPDLPGDVDNFKSFLQAFQSYKAKHPGQSEFLFRSHPAYREKAHVYEGLLRDHNINYIDAAFISPIEKVLSACDVVLSGFSTVSVDHSFLSHYSDRPIGVTVYLMTSDKMKSFLKERFGYWKNPFVEKGLGVCAESSGEILNRLEEAAHDPQALRAYFASSKTKIMGHGSCERIVAKVRSMIDKVESVKL